MNEVEELCNRVAIVRSGRVVYEGEIDGAQAHRGRPYRLRTTDDDRALELCAALRGASGRAPRRRRRSRFSAAEEVVADLSLALVEAGVADPRADAGARRRSRICSSALTEGPQADARACARAPARRGGRIGSPSAVTVYRWELRKLRSQKRTYLGLGAAVARAAHLRRRCCASSGGGPDDVAFGRYIHDTGLAIPLVMLLFGAIWMYPLITALVAGDIVASEDHNGTLKTILTRSLERGQIFTGKMLAAASYAIVAILFERHRRDRRRLPRLRVQPADDAVGHEGLGVVGARAGGGEPGRLPDADPHGGEHRPAALRPSRATAPPRSSAR